MKMVKKILLGLTAAAAVMTFVSCGQREEVGNAEMIDVNAGSSKASIDYTNEGDTLARGFKTLQTNHLDAICHIKMTPNATTAKDTNGVMGFIFNLYKDEATEKYSFSIAGVRYNQSNKKLEGYIETFKDVEASKLEEQLETYKKATGVPTYSGFGFPIMTVTGENNTIAPQVDIWIDVVANDGVSVGRGKDVANSAGTYTVTFYDEDPGRTKGSSNALTYTNIGTGTGKATALKSGVIEATEVFNPFVKAGETQGKLKNMEADIGFYANVQPGERLTGEWKFDAIKMEAEEIEE